MLDFVDQLKPDFFTLEQAQMLCDERGLSLYFKRCGNEVVWVIE